MDTLVETVELHRNVRTFLDEVEDGVIEGNDIDDLIVVNDWSSTDVAAVHCPQDTLDFRVCVDGLRVRRHHVLCNGISRSVDLRVKLVEPPSAMSQSVTTLTNSSSMVRTLPTVRSRII